MSSVMKVLVAYDGSACSRKAMDDLQRAGLPDNVEATVISVADIWVLPEGESVAPPPLGPSATIRKARNTAVELRERAQLFADEGAARLRRLFPTWKVTSITAADSPAWAIILNAEAVDADLIVVGSHGYSALGRWVLGSVSQTVLTHAHTSVRIARGRPTPPDRPLRILVGVDGSIEADLAVRTVAQRHWPQGTDVHLMLVLNPSLIEAVHDNNVARQSVAVTDQTDSLPEGELSSSEVEEVNDLVGRMFDSYVSILSTVPGITVSTEIRSGDPKRVLLEEAEKWGADCIFVGSRGLNRWERMLLGSVSSAIATRAHCPVEVIRRHRILPSAKQ